jgi:hypothetical protein
MIRFAATTFEIRSPTGTRSSSLVGKPVAAVYDPLKSCVFLVEDRGRLIVLHTSHFPTDYHSVSVLLKDRMARALGIPCDQVFCFSSHNHCIAILYAKDRAKDRYPVGHSEPVDKLKPEEELTWEGQELLKLSTEAVTRLRGQLEQVSVRFGAGKERRITHNRKGRRADGSTYLMREEDRLLLGEDFTGDIDDEAFVIGFFREEGKPAGFLTQFTGHPVTAHQPERQIVCAEYPQVACDDLSAAFENVPVGFLQGCAGDTNSKGLLSTLSADESVRRAEGYGHQLGETFIEIAKALSPSKKQDLSWKWGSVTLPFREVPSVWELESRLEGVRNFLRRCQEGDEVGTRRCDGLNFPRNMSVSFRKVLIQPTREWLEWALAFHRENRLHEAPTGVT